MSFLDCDRFHRASRDGHLDLLQEGNKKELNTQDEDGMTPAMWAAYYGHLDALRLIVGRGGDPDKCDFYGNTPLHCASGNGHINCVSFLINFGVNLWALDNDFHTAKDVSVLNRRDDVLRLLDQSQAKHGLVNKKLVQRLKEKSIADAEKRIKNYRKLQLKAVRRAEKEEKIIQRRRKKIFGGEQTDGMHKYYYAPKFSDLVQGSCQKMAHGAVSKKTGQRKKGVEFNLDNLVEIEPSTHSRLCQTDDRQSSDSETFSDFHQTTDSGLGDEIVTTDSSMFERPGFGSVSFRNSTINLACLYGGEDDDDPNNNYTEILASNPQQSSNDALKSDSIGSASSLVGRQEDDDDAPGEGAEVDEEGENEEIEPVVLFLSALGLSEYAPLFQAEKIDLEALSLLTEDDLKSIGMPMGPRRKLENALERRRHAFEEPGTVHDSKL